MNATFSIGSTLARISSEVQVPNRLQDDAHDYGVFPLHRSVRRAGILLHCSSLRTCSIETGNVEHRESTISGGTFHITTKINGYPPLSGQETAFTGATIFVPVSDYQHTFRSAFITEYPLLSIH